MAVIRGTELPEFSSSKEGHDEPDHTALGGTWSVQRTPDPTGRLEDGLDAGSCTSSTACPAVGRYVNRAGAVAVLAEPTRHTGRLASQTAHA